MDAELLRQARILFGAQRERHSAESDRTADENALTAVSNLRPRQLTRLWRHVQAIDGFWEALKETEPGIVSRVAATAIDYRWEVIFLTRRPETAGATAQVQSQRWLEAHGFALPSVFVVPGSRGRIAAALGLDIVVDDRPENCLDVVADSRARAILVWRGDAETGASAAKRLGIGVVHSTGACLDVLTQAERPAPEKGRIIDRVMRLLGLDSSEPQPTA